MGRDNNHRVSGGFMKCSGGKPILSNGIHPDFLKYKSIKPPLYSGVLPLINFAMTKVLYMLPVGDGLSEERFTILGYGGIPISASVIRPGNCHEALPALLYIHGGAFAMQASPHHKRLAAEYALKTPCAVILVDYRLLPKATYPTGLEDCYAAYKWVIENANTLGLNPGRIAIGGDSAGGALSIGVCLLAQRRKLQVPCFQLLIYPVTDARQETPSMRKCTDTPLWNSKLNAKMWEMYLRGVPPEERVHASPAEASSLAGLPPTYVEVAEFDCLCDEGIAFAENLQKSGVPTELWKTKGTVHGFEIAMNNEIVRECVARRIDSLRKAFAENKKSGTM